MIRRYIDRFEAVVDLMRTTGAYTVTVINGTVYTITTTTEHNLQVDDYITLEGDACRVLVIISPMEFTAEAFGATLELFGTWKSMAPFSIYGTRKTINTMILERNGYEFKYQKYPLIALYLPTPVRYSGAVSSIAARVLIATFTNKQYKPHQRKELIFEPILYPLVDSFLSMTRKSGEFMGYDKDYQQIDRMFYGTESGDDQNIANVFDDPLDAVELVNLNLTFIEDDCI